MLLSCVRGGVDDCRLPVFVVLVCAVLCGCEACVSYYCSTEGQGAVRLWRALLSYDCLWLSL